MINPINNPAQIEIVNSNNDYLASRKTGENKFLNNAGLFEKLTSQEQKNTIVSEKLDDNSSIQNFNLQFQPNTPLAKSAKKDKAFNEANKNEKNKKVESDLTNIEDRENSEYLEDDTVDTAEGSGYYLVMNSSSGFDAIKKLQSPYSRMQENIRKIYQQGYRKDPGTLVNLTY